MKTSFVENAQKKQREDTGKTIFQVLEPGIEDANVNKVENLPFNPDDIEKALQRIDEKKKNRPQITPNKFRNDNWKTL